MYLLERFIRLTSVALVPMVFRTTGVAQSAPAITAVGHLICVKAPSRFLSVSLSLVEVEVVAQGALGLVATAAIRTAEAEILLVTALAMAGRVGMTVTAGAVHTILLMAAAVRTKETSVLVARRVPTLATPVALVVAATMAVAEEASEAAAVEAPATQLMVRLATIATATLVVTDSR
jgi:hypothetical protein